MLESLLLKEAIRGQLVINLIQSLKMMKATKISKLLVNMLLVK